MAVVPSEPQAAALLSHVVSQMQQNVDFLVSQNYISSSDASAIIAKLPTSNPPNTLRPTAGPPVRRNIPQPPPRVVRARALWAYNLNGEEPDDLSFAAGDVIEVVAETNDDWWLGKVNGKQALFPSTFVEKIDNPNPPISDNERPIHKPTTGGHYNADIPPAMGVNSTGLQQAPGQEEKKKGFGKYKSTLAHSAAGGVGFGAGAAIAGGLVNAIF